jgi:hemerythrin
MAEFKWDRRLETGIEEIDSQHRELFRRIDAMELSIYEGKSKVEMVIMIEYLESYVEKHFAAEEQLMMSINYPDSSAHRQEHQSFSDLYNKIKNEYKEKGADSYLALDVDKEIRKWWEKHILKSDMAFVPYVKKQA